MVGCQQREHGLQVWFNHSLALTLRFLMSLGLSFIIYKMAICHLPAWLWIEWS